MAWCLRPKLLLLDEPLSSLDANLRVSMRENLVALRQRVGLTTVYVTHDQEEALSLSDRVAVMAQGRIAQEGRPHELYHRPLTRSVASFLGVTNLLPGSVRRVDHHGAQVDSVIGLVHTRATTHTSPGARVLIAVRPERAILHHDRPAATVENVIAGEVERLTFFGDRVDCQVRVGDRLVVVRDQAVRQSSHGDQVWVELPSDSVMVIPSDASGGVDTAGDFDGG